MKKQIASANAHCCVIHYDNGKTSIQKYPYQHQQKSHNKRVTDTEDGVHLNMVQRPMYRQLMYGLTEFTPEQIQAMSPKAIQTVVSRHERAKRALHVMKSKKYMGAETRLINAIFSNSVQIRFDKDCDWMEPLPKGVTLRSLKITTKQVIEEFITRKLLPDNFFSITLQTPVL
jgi:hypothetical protein